MNEQAIHQHITGSFPDTRVKRDGGNAFFFAPGEERFPFATLVTSDQYDIFSDLNRPGVFRLNIGLSRETFCALFPKASAATIYDHAALDRLMPHPVYGGLFWVCVLNPGANTTAQIPALLAGARDIILARIAKRQDENGAA